MRTNTTAAIVSRYRGFLNDKIATAVALAVEGCPVASSFLTDYDCPKGNLFAISTKRIFMNTEVGWEWIDEDGSKWKWVQKRDKFVAYMRNFSQLSTDRRNGLGRIMGIAES